MTHPLALALVLLAGPQDAFTARDPFEDPDSDGDGLSDFQEVHKYGTDPARADSDGDGVGDGDWDERREYTYTVRTVVRVVKPVDVEAANDDYQDARLRAEHEGWVELEVIHYPLGTAAEAIGADPEWRELARDLAAYLESTTTSNWDRGMRQTLHDELRERGTDPDTADDRTLAVAAARQLMDRSRFEDGFTTFMADYEDGRPVVPSDLREKAREEERKAGIGIQEVWERELLARGMFEHRVHGSCTSSAIYLCGGLRAAGIPTRIVLLIPLVDVNDPEQLALVENGIRHHRVRATALKGLRNIGRGWASHTFNEVFVDGRWRRLNYTRLGQPILDEGLFGLTTHVLTVRDWADARMGRTIGRRQGLGLRDEVFATSNPYATIEVTDQFGEHAEIDNPPVAIPEPPEVVTIEAAFWAASDERPSHLNVTRVDLENDRHHVILAARTEDLVLQRGLLNVFWDAVPKGFRLVPEEGEAVPASAVRGMWWGEAEGVPFLYYILRIPEDARERMVSGVTYAIEPEAPRDGERFEAVEGLAIVGR